MALQFFDTRTRQLEEFRPLDPAGRGVKMYTCGPTVYNHAHIGNFRAYIFEDLLQRWLEYRGYKVERVMNLTDVDDKTIRGCREAGVPLAEFTQPYKDAFFDDLKTLRIEAATHFPNATDDRHIERMIAMIAQLIESGIAYQADDGSVYFRIGKFPRYGQLAHLDLDELRPSGRVQNDEYEKESIGDFALWKAWTEADGDVAWESPWGRGRPGWHIECSAMATGLLGPRLDIHCGAVDNIFPHHEAEIAQSESCTGETFVRHWLHCAHLIVDGQKMAKSAGNFFTLRDLLERGWSGREIRYALLAIHYRQQLNFTFDGLAAARAALARIDAWVGRLKVAGSEEPSDFTMPAQAAFDECLDDDLNISGALGHLFTIIRESNAAHDADSLAPADARALLGWWGRIDQTLAIFPDPEPVPREALDLVERREAARKARDWAASDALRDQIAALGWQVKDTPTGQQLSPA